MAYPLQSYTHVLYAQLCSASFILRRALWAFKRKTANQMKNDTKLKTNKVHELGSKEENIHYESRRSRRSLVVFTGAYEVRTVVLTRYKKSSSL